MSTDKSHSATRVIADRRKPDQATVHDLQSCSYWDNVAEDDGEEKVGAHTLYNRYDTQSV